MKTLYRVYLAEDSVEIRFLVSRILGKDNIEVVEFENGKDCLDALCGCHTNGGCNLPDLIITDINMPVMNGHELIANLHKCPRMADIPILVHSSEEEVKNKVFDPIEGAYNIRKPALPSELRAYVGELLATTAHAVVS